MRSRPNARDNPQLASRSCTDHTQRERRLLRLCCSPSCAGSAAKDQENPQEAWGEQADGGREQVEAPLYFTCRREPPLVQKARPSSRAKVSRNALKLCPAPGTDPVTRSGIRDDRIAHSMDNRQRRCLAPSGDRAATTLRRQLRSESSADVAPQAALPSSGFASKSGRPTKGFGRNRFRYRP